MIPSRGNQTNGLARALHKQGNARWSLEHTGRWECRLAHQKMVELSPHDNQSRRIPQNIPTDVRGRCEWIWGKEGARETVRTPAQIQNLRSGMDSESTGESCPRILSIHERTCNDCPLSPRKVEMGGLGEESTWERTRRSLMLRFTPFARPWNSSTTEMRGNSSIRSFRTRRQR